MRPIRLVSLSWVSEKEVYLTPDPEHHRLDLTAPAEFGLDTAEKLSMVCHTMHSERVTRVLDLMAMDPFPCEDGQEWQRFMQMWLEAPGT